MDCPEHSSACSSQDFGSIIPLEVFPTSMIFRINSIFYTFSLTIVISVSVHPLNLGIKVKFTVYYQGIFDVARAFDELWMTFPEASESVGKGNDRMVFHIGQDVTVQITRNGVVQVTWTNEKEKIQGLKTLENALPPLRGKKKAILKPLNQSVHKIPYPPPKDFKLNWCEEATQYFNFDNYFQVKQTMDAIMNDYVVTLNFDAAQRRAEVFYSSDILPQKWKNQLKPLFEQKSFKKLKAQWVSLFIREMQKLLYNKTG